MSAHVPTYSISVNTKIIDKPNESERERADFGKNFQPVEATLDDLFDHISRGHATAPQYKNGHRKTIYFDRAGFLAADVDRGRTLEDAKDHAFVRNHAALIHTTASHTPENNRFRIILLLDESINSARDWTDAQLGLALMLESDRSVTDGARLFFGNRRAVIYRIGGTVPSKVVFDLIARGRDARASRSPGGRVLPVDSVRRIAGPELVKVAGGQLVRMDEVGVPTRVHCPHHVDDDPSAFTLRSRTGRIGIHCSACKVTFWSNDERDGYDFDAFDRLFEEMRAGQQQVEAVATGLDAFFPQAPRFERHQRAYLPALVYEPGITLVKSPKGSGKTEALRFMLDQIRAGRFTGAIARKDRPKSVLLIGHRQSLIREAAAKLGLRCYLDQVEETDGKMRTLAVCLDSLPKYNESRASGLAGRPAPFDLVIIDESEQVLSHLLSKTIKDRLGIERCFDALMYEVANAKAVVALDADLGLVTTHALRTMRRQDWASRCRIVYNAPIVPVQKRVMRLHRSKNFLVAQMIEAIKRGERCFIVSNSKRFVDIAHRMIRNVCGEGIIMSVVTRDNSRDETTLRFLANIKTEILKVQVVLASPSIGTGIDITFPNGVCQVDRVFGFFYPFVNTHTDIDQQLARVRNPGAVDIWISPATFDFTCNVDVIKDDLARAYIVRRAVRGRPRADGMVDYDRDDPLLMICAHVTALQRASKNRLVELFRGLREANGWAVEWVNETAPPGLYGPARKMLDAERTEMLLNAETICDADYIELDERVSKGASITKEERIMHERNHFERTVGVPLDAGLVAMNVDGRLLESVAALAEIVSIWSKDYPDGLIDALLAPTSNPNGRLQQMEPARLIAVLMRVAGLTDVHGFNAEGLTSIDTLPRFTGICRENRTVIEETFGEPLRGDFGEKPVRQLNRFLGRIGLKVEHVKTEKVAGRKIRYYAIPTSLLETMMGLARCYLDVRVRNEYEKERTRMEGRTRRSPAEKKAEDDTVPSDDIGLFSESILGGSS